MLIIIMLCVSAISMEVYMLVSARIINCCRDSDWLRGLLLISRQVSITTCWIVTNLSNRLAFCYSYCEASVYYNYRPTEYRSALYQKL